MNWWPLLLFAGFMGFIFFMTHTKVGRGRSLGGRITWTSSEHVLNETKFTHGKEVLFIHVIEVSKSNENTRVGIELRSRSAMHFNVIPITLDFGKEVLFIHVIEISKSNENTRVGIELRSRSAMHFNVIPITLDLDQARKIKQDLGEAIRRADV